MSTRTSRVARNWLFGTISSLTTLVLGFAITPYLLRLLGAERFGAVRVLIEWFGHISILQLGLSAALLPFLVTALQSGRDSAAHALGNALRLNVVPVCLMFFLGCVLCLFVARVVPVSPMLAGDLRKACALLALATLLSAWVPLNSAYEAAQRADIVQTLGTVQTVFVAVCSLVVALQWPSITAQAGVLLVGHLLTPVVLLFLARRDFPGTLGYSLERVSPEVRHRLVSANWTMLAVQLLARVSLASDATFVALFAGTGNVVVLLGTQRLLLLAQSQVQGLGTASWSALAQLRALGRTDEVVQRILDLTRATSILAAVAVASIVSFNASFVAGWLGTEVFGGLSMSAVLGVNVFLQCSFAFWIWCFVGAGIIRPLLFPYVLMSAVNVSCSILLTRRFGAIGAPAGTFVANVAVSLWLFPLLLRRYFLVPIGTLYSKMSGPFLLALLGSAAGIWAADRISLALWPSLMAMALLATLLFALAWLLILDARERRDWSARVRYILASRVRGDPS